MAVQREIVVVKSKGQEKNVSYREMISLLKDILLEIKLQEEIQ